MPKKSKKSLSTDSDLPDLETRRAHLRAIGMPSPYRGETTSSSSFDDSSSSTTANEIEESSGNTERPGKAAGDASAIACHSADDGKNDKIEFESPDVTVAASDTEPQIDSNKLVGVICEQKSPVIDKALGSGYILEEGNTSTMVTSVLDKCYQNSPKRSVTGGGKSSIRKSLEQPSRKHECMFTTCLLKTSKDPKTSKGVDCVEDNRKLSNATARSIPFEEDKDKDKSKDSLSKIYPVGGASVQKEVNREDEKSKTLKKDSRILEGSSHSTYSKHEPSAKYMAERVVISEAVILETKARNVTQATRTTDASSKQKDEKIAVNTECPTEVLSKEGSKGVASTKQKKEVAYKERSKSVTPPKSGVPLKERAKNVTPTKHITEVSSEKRLKSVTPPKSKVPSKDRAKNVTPTKNITKVSSTERAKSVTPSKSEVSSKERAVNITPPKSKVSLKERAVNITPPKLEVSSKERAVNITPPKSKVSSKERAKSITPPKSKVSSKERAKSITPPKSEVSSKERAISITPPKSEVSSKERAKSITPPKSEVSSKERAKSITPPKSKVPSKDRAKNATPTENTSEVSSKERARSITPNKYKTEVSSKEKAKEATAIFPEISPHKDEKTISPTKYTSKVPLEERKKTLTPTEHTTDASREKSEKTLAPTKYKTEVPLKRTKTETPTKYSPEALSKGKPKSLTPTKCTPEVPPKERTKTPVKCSSEALSKGKEKHLTPPKCTPEDPSKEKIRTETPAKSKSDALSHEKCEKTSTLAKCTLEVPSKEGTKTVTPVKHTSDVALKEMPKTPTKRMPTASSNENRAKSVTPSKRTPEVLSKVGTKSETQFKKTSAVFSPDRFEKSISPNKCTPETSTGGGDLKPETPLKNTTVTRSQERVVKKLVASTKCTEETSRQERGTKPVTPTKCTKGCAKESPVKYITEGVRRESESECKTHPTFAKPNTHGFSEDPNKVKSYDSKEQNVISFKEFKEALGVDRMPPPDINFDVFDRAVGVDKISGNSSQSRNPEHEQQTPRVISTEEFLEALAMAINSLKLQIVSLNESKTETKIEPTSATEPPSLVPRLTIEEFRSALGTDKTPPARTDDDLEVFNKALEKLEAKRRRRVTFLIPNEPAPSTSRARTSPEKQLDNEVSRNTEPPSDGHQTLSGGTLTFEEFHRGLRTLGFIKPELLNLDVFDKALEEMERSNASQPAQEVHKSSCRPDPLGESDESDSSDEDINKAIAISGMKLKRFHVASSDDEPKTTRNSDPSKMSRQHITKIGESKLCEPVITGRILEEDLYLSESTSKSSAASPEESSGKSSEPDVVSSESVVKSSESETSTMESIEKSPEEETESSESALKSTESEPSPEEYIEVFKESMELYESAKPSDFKKSRCEIKVGRDDSSGSSEKTQLKSPKKRRRSERIISILEKSVGKEQRSRTRSESDLRKRRTGKKDIVPRKKRHSDEH